MSDGVIEALGHPQKERLKHEDTNISNWLQGRYCVQRASFLSGPVDFCPFLINSKFLSPSFRSGKLQCQRLQEVPDRADWVAAVCGQPAQGCKKVSNGCESNLPCSPMV